MNPEALKKAIEEACVKTGVACPTVAAVVGDDIRGEVEEWRSKGLVEPFSVLGEEVVSM
jgi:hypothetical protein